MLSNTRLKRLIKPGVLILIGILTIYSTSVLILYRITPTAHLNETNETTKNLYPEINPAERFTPFDILNYHINLIRNTTGIADYGSKLMNSYNGGRSFALLLLGVTDPIVRVEERGTDKFRVNFIPNNTKESFLGTVDLVVEKENKVLGEFHISNVNTSTYKFIDLECSAAECSFPDEKAFSISKTSPKTDDLQFFDLSNGYRMSLSTSNNMKFVNYKLKRS